VAIRRGEETEGRLVDVRHHDHGDDDHHDVDEHVDADDFADDDERGELRRRRTTGRDELAEIGSVTLGLCVAGSVVDVAAPASLAPALADFYKLALAPAAGVPGVAIEGEAGDYSISAQGRVVASKLTLGGLLARLAELLPQTAAAEAKGDWLRAAALGWEDKVALVAGRARVGRSALAAWLIDRGFSCQGSEYACVRDDGRVAGFPGPLIVADPATPTLAKLAAFRDLASADGDDSLIVAPAAEWRAAEEWATCGLVVVVEFAPGAALSIEALDFARDQATIAAALQTTFPGATPLPPSALAFLARTPIVRLRFGDTDAFDGILDHLVRSTLEAGIDAQAFARFAGAFAGQAAAERAAPAQRFEIPKPTARRFDRFLTIGMATYDDYDGVYFSLQALRMYHPEIVEEAEFVVVDNHPDGPCAEQLKQLEHHIANYRYIPAGEFTGTAIKNAVFVNAGGEFVLCMDSHVFFVPGALKRLIAYMRAQPETRDLLQGPLVYDDLKTFSTHFDPVWRGGMYGTWGTDPRGLDPDGEPFDIPMQGMGVFACRRAAWPGFNPRFRGFGGEEGYIHEKTRQRGGRTLCLPFLRWMHRFNRPMGIPYRNTWEDRFRNYMIGFMELGLPLDGVKQEIVAVLGEEAGRRLIATLEGELSAPGS
jgi:hypothetical protein